MAEHMLQFGIWIDDDAIQKKIVEKTTEEVWKQVESQLGVQKEGWGRTNSETYIKKLARSAVFEKVAKEMEQTDLKEMIIQRAVTEFLPRITNTKVFKDAVRDRVLLMSTEELKEFSHTE